MIASLALGFVTSLTLIVAIGAQNAFVLRQGILREHVGPVVLVCAVSDAVLISAGIGGLGALIAAQPQVLTVVRYAGAAFLLIYAGLSVRRVLRPAAMTVSGRPPARLSAVLLATLGFTFLNPHVYLDTVILLGSLGNQQGPEGRWWYAVGAVAASLSWFVALGFGARLLRGAFERPRSWQILDGLIAVVMVGIAGTLIFA